MKVQVISDLHLEFGATDFNFSNADVVILAGDVHVGTDGINWIKEYIPNKPVIYVLGNHEYYKGSYPKTLIKIKEQARGSNVHVLENESIEINNVVFHGATMWTDFAIFGESKYHGVLCQEKMNDFQKIRRDPSYSKLRSMDVSNIHLKSKVWLISSLKRHEGKTNVVITHHAPSINSVPLELRSNPISSGYASNLESIILEHAPSYWIHGHIHNPIHYSIGNTQVVSNPRGYATDPYNGYDRELILEV